MSTTKQTPADITREFSPATLVLAGRWQRGRPLAPRPAVVVGPSLSFGCEDGGDTVTVWYFLDGAPEPGPTVQVMFLDELTPIDDTLSTMHAGAFRDMVRSLRRGRFPEGDGEELRDAVRKAWRQRTGLAEADPAARLTADRH